MSRELFLFIDAETSGLLRDDLPVGDPSQPHLLQLAAKLVLPLSQRCVARFSYIVRPDGWHIEPDAERVHGISERVAAAAGVPLWLALAGLKALCTNATMIIGHNIQGFDRLIIAAALKREGVVGAWWNAKAGIMFDTMEAATSVVRLPGQYGHKFPSLEEAVRFFGRDWTSTHDAGDDVDATEFLFWSLRRHNATAETAGAG